MEHSKPQAAPEAAQATKTGSGKRIDWTARLNKSKAADYLVVILALLPAFVMYYDSYSPTSAIYFTYFKNFFDLPFSFQPGTVAFGATSPLHVLIHAPIHALFGQHWILASKLVNFLLVGVGLIVLNRAIKGGIRTILLTSLLAILSAGMLLSVSQLFESGLAFFAMALLYYYITERQQERALLVSGMLYLVRPELFLVTIVVSLYIMLQSDTPKRLVPWMLAGLAPMVFYHGYMLIAGGSLVPTALLKPIILYIQEPTTWPGRFAVTLTALWNSQGLIYIVGAVLILVMLVEWSAPRYSRELLLVAPLAILFLLVPPQEPVIRYLVPVLPALIAIIVRYIEKDLKVQHSVQALVVSLVLAHMFGATVRAGVPAVTRDEVLLTGLSNGINKLAYEDDHVLLYNIQGQYTIKAPCHDLSGSVGHEMADVLLRRMGVDEFIRSNDVRYVVTSDDLESRALYANTLLAELSHQDPACALGDTVVIDGLAFEKLFSHSAFVRRTAAHQTGIVAPDGSPGPVDAARVSSGRYDTRWNTVYKVLGDEADLARSVIAYHEPTLVMDSTAYMAADNPTTGEEAEPTLDTLSTAPDSIPLQSTESETGPAVVEQSS